jgi:hypothetical protein
LLLFATSVPTDISAKQNQAEHQHPQYRLAEEDMGVYRLMSTLEIRPFKWILVMALCGTLTMTNSGTLLEA